MAMMIVRASAMAALLWLTGCATATYEPTGPQTTTEIGTEPAADPAPKPAVEAVQPEPARRGVDASSTIARIAARAQAQLAAGDYEGAIDTAERGLRVDRYAAGLYKILAEGYTGLGVVEQARNFARLGLRYVGADRVLKDQLELLAGQ